jgi:hypothetical protein
MRPVEVYALGGNLVIGRKSGHRPSDHRFIGSIGKAKNLATEDTEKHGGAIAKIARNCQRIQIEKQDLTADKR